MAWVYDEENTLPMTATPSAPPIWRAASLTPEPTPARSAGTLLIRSSVAGAVTKPIPAPRSAAAAIGTGQNGVST